MLYLAEIQKQKGGFIGSGKAELKLLACQRTEQNWSAIQGEELVAAPDEASAYGAGVLVLVDMNANRQIQAPLREAGRHLVSILQNLSRQIEKYKKEADEIESWRQSLGLQSQQLQLRQEEIYSREEELESTRGELERMTQESQQLEETLKSSEKQRQELAAAWEKLREEQQTLEQMQGERVEGLSTHQIDEMRSLVSQLHQGAPGNVQETLHAIEFQQDILQQHWDKLHQQQQHSAAESAEIEKQQQQIADRKQELQQLQTTLEQAQTEWEVQQNALTIRQEYAQQLANRIHTEEEGYQKILMMSRGNLDFAVSDKVDLEQIEGLPLEELTEIVASLQKEVTQGTNMVAMQEEELTERQADIVKMEEEMAEATAFDKLNLENELTDEQDAYQMLEQTLEGQRETLVERQAILDAHISILEYRQGSKANGDGVEWDAVLKILAEQRQQQQAELTRTQGEIQNLQTALEQSKARVEEQVNEYLAQSEAVQKMELNLLSLQQNATEVRAKLALYEEMIQPLQGHINSLKDSLGGVTAQVGGSGAIDRLEAMLDDFSYNSQASLAN
jgi:chromosome segregation ATPase